MSSRAPNFPDQRINGKRIARARGLDDGLSPSPPSPLPPHTHQIMDAFLWNKKNNATKHEQKKRQEVQSLILSRLQRQRSVVQPHVEVQPLLPMQPRSSSTNTPNENISNHKRWNAVNGKTKTNHRSHNHHRETHPSSSTYQPLNNRIDDDIRMDDEEECCGCGDGGLGCNEGKKNLCTITLWALIVFAIFNRFIVHMAMHLHKSESVTAKDVGVIPTGNNEVGLLEMQHVGVNANFTVVGNEGNGT
mmetsp:Transcript_30450/g.52801  ORF Transcript_30450/g.52801 Transcript_30450/m.52801 type:complete len:247 (-) Transcript_30450:110-850(-)